METQKSIEKAKKLYGNLSDELKELLHDIYGKDAFDFNYESIISLELAIKYCGDQDEDVVCYHKMVKAGIEGHTMRYQELVIITKAINEKWVPDWTTNEPKWYGYFDMRPSGFGLSYAYYDNWFAHTYCGSRLYFKDEKRMRFAFAQFTEKYKEFITIKK